MPILRRVFRDRQSLTELVESIEVNLDRQWGHMICPEVSIADDEGNELSANLVLWDWSRIAFPVTFTISPAPPVV